MTFIRDYKNDQNIEQDIQKLIDHGVDQNDIFVLTHDDQHTSDLANESNANTISASHTQDYDHKGDELRAQLEEIGISEQAAEQYEEILDKEKLLLIVKGDHNVEELLH